MAGLTMGRRLPMIVAARRVRPAMAVLTAAPATARPTHRPIAAARPNRPPTARDAAMGNLPVRHLPRAGLTTIRNPCAPAIRKCTSW